MSAVNAVNTEIFDALSGADATEQQQIDADLIALTVLKIKPAWR